jgi:primosomal protein N' (replication factor Y)
MQSGIFEQPDFVQVAIIEAPLPLLTYRVSAGAVFPEVGARVLVPLSGRPVLGVAMGRAEVPSADVLRRVRDVGEVLDAEPLLSARDVELCDWIASYYHSHPGEVLKHALPAALRIPGQRRIVLTEAGERALAAGVVDEIASAVFARLQEGAQSIASLRKANSGLTFRAVDRWEAAGWVVSEWLAASGPKTKVERWIWLVRDPFEGERLGFKQDQIVVRLQSAGDSEAIRLEDLRREIAGPLPSIRALERREIVRVEEREVYRDPFRNTGEREAPPEHELTADQSASVGAIIGQIEAGEFRTFLLHGVTGSGKTEVYVRCVREALRLGRTALILLPEISLTPQFVGVFRAYFGDRIAVLHSGLSKGERFDEWRRIVRGEAGIVIGARSAIFAPLDRIGVIVVDEEHDGSFKQESGCRYNARDVAQYRGNQWGAVVILGSATPALETYHNASTGRIGYLPMASRVASRALPPVELVDVRAASGNPVDDAGLSGVLREALRTTVEAGEQAILFLNRRGFAPSLSCCDCGHVWRCPNCSVSLTWHRRPNRLRCHYCDHLAPRPSRCPSCSSLNLGQVGVGTERLEAALGDLLPGASVARLDRDTARGSRLASVLGRFHRREVDVLVGTQMVTKGHDFPGVTLVGVVLADLGLNFPDFRAAERTFQLVTQVAGRAGRGEQPGRVLVQTYVPDVYVLLAAQLHSYAEFVSHELPMRRELGYPPFAHLVAVHFEGGDRAAVVNAARAWSHRLIGLVASVPAWRTSVTILGPAEAPLGRIRNKNRWQLLLKSSRRGAAHELLGRATSPAPKTPGVRVTVDVDPQNML